MCRNRLLTLLMGIGLTVASTSGMADDSDEPVARAVVSGPENRVYELHQNVLNTLAGLLGTRESGELLILCDILGRPGLNSDCKQLSDDDEDMVRIQYIFSRDHTRLEALALAWGQAQSRDVDEDLKIAFDMDVPTPDCGGIAACVSAPFCAGPPRGCDKVKGPPCTPC